MKPPLKLSDLLKSPSPAFGGIGLGMGGATTPASIFKNLPRPVLSAPAAPAPVAPAPAARSVVPAAPPVRPNPSAAPVGPAGATGAAPVNQNPQIPAKFIKADGTIKTPAEIAAEVGTSLASAHNNGDVGTLSLGQFGGGNKSAVELEAEARRVGNARNDIAVGETDPYKVASQSGIQYTASELAAIEKAYAGIYDPALDTALAKVNAKQKSDEQAAASKADLDRVRLQGELDANKPYTLGKDEVRYGGNGQPIAVGVSSTSASGSTYAPGTNPTVDAYVKGRLDGTYKPTDIPDEYKSLVAQGIAQTKPQVSKTSNDAISVIDELSTNPGLEDISGFRVMNPTSLFPGTAVQTTQNLAKQLAGILALQNRTQLQGQGAISDFEFRVLGDASSALGLDQNGRTNLSPEDFKYQLNKLKLKLQVGPTDLTDDELLHLQSKGYSPEDIRQAGSPQSFNSVGNTTASTGKGNRPQRNNNPGNVKSGGLADSLAVGRDDQNHLIFPDAETGFKALAADLTAKINGGSSRLPPNPTIAQLGSVYAEDPNWPKRVAQFLNVPVTAHTKTIPIQSLIQAIATQEGFYA